MSDKTVYIPEPGYGGSKPGHDSWTTAPIDDRQDFKLMLMTVIDNMVDVESVFLAFETLWEALDKRDNRIAELEGREAILYEAAEWVLNVASGIGKYGIPEQGEYIDAMDALKRATEGKGDAE